MILDKNLPREGRFVGLVQRFVVFGLNNKGFTLVLMKTQRVLKSPLKRVSIACVWRLYSYPYERHYPFQKLSLLPSATLRLQCCLSPHSINRSTQPVCHREHNDDCKHNVHAPHQA